MRNEIVTAQRSILLNLAACEDLIGDLYEAYERLFPASSPLWAALASDERSHARVLTALSRLLDDGHLFWDIGLFRENAVASQVAVVRTALERARQRLPTEAEALRTATRIEAALLDSKFYSLVRSDAKEFTCIAGILSRATNAHMQRLRDWILAPRTGGAYAVRRVPVAVMPVAAATAAVTAA
jgi:hypothetical protein